MAICSRTDVDADSTFQLSADEPEKFPGQQEWQQWYDEYHAKLDVNREQRRQNTSGFMQRLAEPKQTPGLPATVEELTAALAVLGLPGDPHPDRTNSAGEKYKAPGRFKQKEAARRNKRLQLIQELRSLPGNEPLPVCLTTKVQEILARSRRGAK